MYYKLEMQFETLEEFQEVLGLIGRPTGVVVNQPVEIKPTLPTVADGDPVAEDDDDAEDPDFRKIGEASSGRARRTKAEIREDKTLEDLAEELDVSKGNLTKSIKNNGRAETLSALNKQKEEGTGEVEEDEKPQISKNPENRKPADDDGDDGEKITKADVREQMSKLMEKIGQDKARAFMVTETGKGKLGDIDEDDYADFVAAIKEELDD